VLADMTNADDASSKAAHPFARTLLAGLLLGLAASVLAVAHFAIYARHGTAGAVTHVASKLLFVSSDFVLASLLLLVSQGKCISYVMVAADAWRMLRLLGPFLIPCFFLELWADYSVSRMFSVDYVYTTPCGWALILADVLLLGVYAANLRRTHAVEYDRGNAVFYRTCGIAYGGWFLALPLTAVLSQAVLAPYAWFVVSLAVTRASTLCAYAALVLGLWPGNARTYFKLFVAAESVLEDCVTPPGEYSWDGHPAFSDQESILKDCVTPPRKYSSDGHPAFSDEGAFSSDKEGAQRAWLPTVLAAMKQASANIVAPGMECSA